MGEASGCGGCQEVYIDYLSLLLLYLLFFAATSQLFVHFLCYSFLFQYFL